MNLPIDLVLADITRNLADNNQLLLHAEPGAGKTTRVPLAIFSANWLGEKKILMLEPRRVAAVAAAEFMSESLGERAGESVGYRTRSGTKVGPTTKLEVVTEAILTRLMLDDPELVEYGAVIFDEFHERSVNSDLGLAFCLESQATLRPDLRIIVMSATLEVDKLQSLMSGSAIVRCPGRTFPVEIRYLSIDPRRRFEESFCDAALQILRDTTGDALCFLPGAGEIRRCFELLKQRVNPQQVELFTLMGEMNFADQRAVLYSSRNDRRRVILATNIAETSVTIEGIRVVIDGGLMRVPRVDHTRGMTTLETVPVSQASATQRAGRAGRQTAGICYRLWGEATQRTLRPFNAPEIQTVELSAVLLQTAAWGSAPLQELPLLDYPSQTAIDEARETLYKIGAIDAPQLITPHGKALVGLGTHPRLAHMLLIAKEKGLGADACLLAALLEERDLLRGKTNEPDLASRWQVLVSAEKNPSVQRIRESARRFRERLGVREERSDLPPLGLLVGYAYPEWIAQSRNVGGAAYLLVNGTGATLPAGSALARHKYLAVAALEGSGANARILLAEPLCEDDVREVAGSAIEVGESTFWQTSSESVKAASEERFGAIRLHEKPGRASDEQALPILLEQIRLRDLRTLAWDPESENFLERARWFREWIASGNAAAAKYAALKLPDLRQEWLKENLSVWLAPFLPDKRSLRDLADVPVRAALEALFSASVLRTLNAVVPPYVILPTGTKAWISYEGTPSIAVKLQELFGCAETPRICEGKIPLTIELLSPARRPLQVTSDLGSFWRNAYPKLRSEMRAKYPRHDWPEDGATAVPSKGPKRRR